MYRKWSKGKEFPRMHVLTKLEKCPKWEKTRLTEVIDVEEGGGAPSVGSVGCPIGNKKAKAKRNGARDGNGDRLPETRRGFPLLGAGCGI